MYKVYYTHLMDKKKICNENIQIGLQKQVLKK